MLADYSSESPAIGRELVVVPLSSAHLTETAKRYGPTRLELASTMMRVSRGWHMRSVLRLVARSFVGCSTTRHPSEDTRHSQPTAILDLRMNLTIDQELGPETAGLVERLVWVIVLVDLLFDPTPDGDARHESAT